MYTSNKNLSYYGQLNATFSVILIYLFVSVSDAPMGPTYAWINIIPNMDK